MSTGGLILVAVAIAIGLVGVLVPFLPGTLLVWAAIAVWAIVEQATQPGWSSVSRPQSWRRACW